MKICLLISLLLISLSIGAENSTKKPSKKIKNKKPVQVQVEPKTEEVKEAKMEYYDGDPLAPLKIQKERMKEMQKKQKK